MKILGDAISAIKELEYIANGGTVKKPKYKEVLENLKKALNEYNEFKDKELTRVAISEGRNGVWFIEILQNQSNKLFRLVFPQDAGESTIEIPHERLLQLKEALDDVAWANRRFTAIPDKD